MQRSPVLLLIVLALYSAFASRAFALTEQEKRVQFLQAREEMKTVPRTSPTTTPKPKPKPKPAVRPKLTPKPKPSASRAQEEDEEEADSTPAPKASRTPSPKPKPKPATEEDEATPKPVSKPTPRTSPTAKPASSPVRSPSPVHTHTPAPTATPAPSVSPVQPPATASPAPSAPLTIEKSGLEQEEGFVPPEPEPRHWWTFRGPKYKYLTRAIRAEIDRAKVKKKRWRYIVVHNSGSRQGSAKIFDYYHRRVRKMPNGLAYHFVIGNGRSSGDGQIEIGGRWRRQINGGHVHSDYLNNIAVGICLVGDYNRDKPTPAQLEALEELIKYLRNRVGKTDGKVATVLPHKRINPPRWPTDCPGDRFPYVWFRRFD